MGDPRTVSDLSCLLAGTCLLCTGIPGPVLRAEGNCRWPDPCSPGPIPARGGDSQTCKGSGLEVAGTSVPGPGPSPSLAIAAHQCDLRATKGADSFVGVGSGF